MNSFGAKPYACSLCGRTFSRKYNMERHAKTFHNENACNAFEEEKESARSRDTKRPANKMTEESEEPANKDGPKREGLAKDIKAWRKRAKPPHQMEQRPIRQRVPVRSSRETCPGDRTLIRVLMRILFTSGYLRPKQSRYFLLKKKDRDPGADTDNLRNVRWKLKNGITFCKDVRADGAYLELISFSRTKSSSNVRKLFPSRNVLTLRQKEYQQLLTLHYTL